jgi:hypothetical protein
MGFLDFIDKILPPSEDICNLQKRQRELDKHYDEYKGPNTRQQEEECKKQSS